MLICDLNTGRICGGIFAPNPKSFFTVRKSCLSIRRGILCTRATAFVKDKAHLNGVLAKFSARKEVSKLYEWLENRQSTPSSAVLDRSGEDVRLSDILERLEKSHDLASLWKETPKEQESKHFLVSLVHKVYSKVLKKERKKFADAFDREAAKAFVKTHWHPLKPLAMLGRDLNPSQPEEGFYATDHFDLPGEDVAAVFEAIFEMPLPTFDKKANFEYIKILMAIAAKTDRRYLGLVHMGMPQPFTPYHAYAMVRSAFEAELLDPRDFKSKAHGFGTRPGSHKAQRRKSSPPVVNRSKKGFGRHKDDPHKGMNSLHDSDTEEEGLLFALDFIELYSDLPQSLWPSLIFLENVASVNQSLKKGTFAYDSRHCFVIESSEDFVATLLGLNQAPVGEWVPSMAEKGLIPNIKDVRYMMNQVHSHKYLDMYWDVMGLPEDKKDDWVDLNWVSAAPHSAMRSVHYMASIGQLGERMQQEGHQAELWEELKQECLQPSLWALASRIDKHDRSWVEDPISCYRLRFVSENPMTLEVVRPEKAKGTAEVAMREGVSNKSAEEELALLSNGVLPSTQDKQMQENADIKDADMTNNAEERKLEEDGLHRPDTLQDSNPALGNSHQGASSGAALGAAETGTAAKPTLLNATPDLLAGKEEALAPDQPDSRSPTNAPDYPAESPDIDAHAQIQGSAPGSQHQEASTAVAKDASGGQAESLGSHFGGAAEEVDDPPIWPQIPVPETAVGKVEIDSSSKMGADAVGVTLIRSDACPDLPAASSSIQIVQSDTETPEGNGVSTSAALTEELVLGREEEVDQIERQGELVDAEASTSASTSLQDVIEIPGWQNLLTNASTDARSWVIDTPDIPAASEPEVFIKPNAPTHRRDSYILPELKDRHKRSWKAAGVLPYTFIQGKLRVLLGHSRRQVDRRREGLTLLGGKREKSEQAAFSDESPKATALRELSEETGGLLSADNIDESLLTTVLWYPNGGYACYFVEVGADFHSAPARYEAIIRSGPPRHRSEPIRLRWVALESLRIFRRAESRVSFLQLIMSGTVALRWLEKREAELQSMLSNGHLDIQLLDKPRKGQQELPSQKRPSSERSIPRVFRRKVSDNRHWVGNTHALGYNPYPGHGAHGTRVVVVNGYRISERFQAAPLLKLGPISRAPTPVADLSVSLLSAASAYLPQDASQSSTSDLQGSQIPCSHLFPASAAFFLPPVDGGHADGSATGKLSQL